ncbi:5-oxoprolinase subunit B family protein [Cyclobacterium marinum]|uniref:5-oxoprolinase subunit B family protein n=1 Tax=Cyclobacterium marinum TaxID=104 RepID=UPI0011EDC4BE|nr:carboxyltransferase domain-containing protein [Cyclobacterium marinum]MBI0397838.1 carboxyltransferase domain-containing protein [Cyclobacterium marinum]|tara:strand:+ start:32438 stop:33157 length:720 start_codon:yes stop_codon:yes gene_type:complete
MKYPIKILYIGNDIIELHWPEIIEEDLLVEMITLKNLILRKWHIIISSIYHSYQILSVRLKHVANSTVFIAWLEELMNEPLPELDLPQRWIWTIPVCYEQEIAPSINIYLEKKNMDAQTFIKQHCARQYLLYFYGFLPGFMYLGGLPKTLHIPRKDIPDRKINKGSVAIGGAQTGIYPIDSPGGWYVVGKMPIPIFGNGKLNLPFNPGDKIQFEAISSKEFTDIQGSTNYHWKKTIYHG